MATDPYTYPVELAAALADRLRSAKQELVTQWLNRISERVAISTNRVFPTHALINHVPILVEGIAGYLKRPERDIDAKAPVVAKAMELGALRHQQGFDAYELLKEYEMLAEILFDFLAGCADSTAQSHTSSRTRSTPSPTRPRCSLNHGSKRPSARNSSKSSPRTPMVSNAPSRVWSRSHAPRQIHGSVETSCCRTQRAKQYAS